MSSALLQNLLNVAGISADAAAEKFSPVARYYPGMDALLFLKEDCSYRADRIDPFLTVLMHPYEDRLVGIKLKGFRFIFERIKAVLELKEEHFLPLVKAIEIALVGGMAEAMMQKEEGRRVIRMYDQARQLSEGVSFDPRELRMAA